MMQPEPITADPPPPQPHRLMQGRIGSPAGDILLVWDENERVRALDFGGFEGRRDELLRRRYEVKVEARELPVPDGIKRIIDLYFQGDIAAIHDLPFAIDGTDFQRTVWKALMEVPPGKTCSYADIAARIGNPKGVRAVGLANGANPIALAVPCHRVIGANGSLTGYGGGLDRKLWLLRHEGALLA